MLAVHKKKHLLNACLTSFLCCFCDLRRWKTHTYTHAHISITLPPRLTPQPLILSPPTASPLLHLLPCVLLLLSSLCALCDLHSTSPPLSVNELFPLRHSRSWVHLLFWWDSSDLIGNSKLNRNHRDWLLDYGFCGHVCVTARFQQNLSVLFFKEGYGHFYAHMCRIKKQACGRIRLVWITEIKINKPRLFRTWSGSSVHAVRTTALIFIASRLQLGLGKVTLKWQVILRPFAPERVVAQFSVAMSGPQP